MERIRSGYTYDDLSTAASCGDCSGRLTRTLTTFQLREGNFVVAVPNVPAQRCDSEDCGGAIRFPTQVVLDLHEQIVELLGNQNRPQLAQRLSRELTELREHFSGRPSPLLKPPRPTHTQ